ncbi:DNA mismatch repair endonuclease MutL [Kiritimatiellaeota bacterium B1221]|nr:DNA mismatch repair endonuclease MutL [Kiritimatiellaeota bacterium B1221]
MPAEPANIIRVLSDHVCNKIAAGEVIERPASVLKELVENSVDAGADRIEVEVLQGGRKAVIINDNGCGMDRDTALLAIERHATSKIRDVDDIEHIHTMGFRGEALAAISSVARFILTTRPADQLSGTRLEIEGGTLRNVEETGCPAGTRIEVRNLFFNVPARRKFLRTESTELNNIRSLFRVFALAHPDIQLILKVDGRELERYPVQARFEDRIADLHGAQVLQNLKPVSFQHGELKIHGFTGLPTLHRSDRRDQVCLINRRPATAPILAYAIRESYTDTLPKGRHPVCFLHLDMPADWVDVNVHPTKREVRFGPSQLLRDCLIKALTESLQPNGPPAEIEPPPPCEPPQAQAPQFHPEHRQPELPPAPENYPPLPPLPPQTARPEQPAAPPPPPPTDPLPQTDAADQEPGLWKDAVYLGNTGDRYALFQTEDGLLIMNPSAATERILFEQARTDMEKGKVASQALLVPETVACDPQEAKQIEKRKDDLQALGFVLADFGGNHFLVEAMPAWMGDADPASTLKELAMETDPQAGKLSTPKQLRDRLARSCCYLAARSRRNPSPAECTRLLKTLAKCQMPYTTPFGRPTLLHMDKQELNRKFGLDRPL